MASLLTIKEGEGVDLDDEESSELTVLIKLCKVSNKDLLSVFWKIEMRILDRICLNGLPGFGIVEDEVGVGEVEVELEGVVGVDGDDAMFVETSLRIEASREVWTEVKTTCVEREREVERSRRREGRERKGQFKHLRSKRWFA